MKDMATGHGEGCYFENEDRFSHAHGFAQQAIIYGFLLCFATTSVGTIIHNAFNRPARSSLWSLPKILGISGGVLLTIGCGWMFELSRQSGRKLEDSSAWCREFGFLSLV